MTYLPVALTIAGTDPSGGAGIMADLKSFQARDVYGMAVVTSLVAQNTRGVQLIEHVCPQSPIRECLFGYPTSGCKNWDVGNY